MSATLFEQLASGQAPSHVPLTVTQFHRMIEAGWLEEGEPVELVEGVLVRKDRSATGEGRLTHGKRHASAVAMLRRLDRQLEGRGCHVRAQLPVTLTETSEPEPDGAVVVGTDETYLERHPGQEDVLAVIEVSDSSLPFDRGAKLHLYAGVGIPVYLLVNLPEQKIELYEEPDASSSRYRIRRDFPRGQTLPVRLRGETLVVRTDDLLPK